MNTSMATIDLNEVIIYDDRLTNKRETIMRA